MSIAQPYLLFLGDVTDPLAAKTARGIHQWRPEICLGQLRLTEQAVPLGLADMTLQEAQAQGAKSMDGPLRRKEGCFGGVHNADNTCEADV